RGCAMSASVLTRLAQLEARYAPTTAPTLPPDAVALAAAGGLVLDAWQEAAVRSPAARQLWNVSRQAGKSTVAALLALFVALQEPGSLVLALAPAERQAAELLRKAQALYRDVGPLVPADSEAVLKLELANGSRILALPGKTDSTIRGFSGVRLLL